jgi:hypothetical protein
VRLNKLKSSPSPGFSRSELSVSLDAVRRLIFICNILAMAGIVGTPLAAAGDPPRSLYDGASVWFAQAQFIKPHENTNHSRAFSLAPLFLQEISTTNATTPASQLAMTSGGKGAMAMRHDLPNLVQSVHFQLGKVLIHGQPHEQMTYWWSYQKPKRVERRRPTRRGPVARLLQHTGAATNAPDLILRLTLGTNGIPAIYEVFATRSDLQQIFVARSVELAAQAEFGPALPGRRHAMERSLSEAPQIVVSRVIENSPDAMGPILYLDAESGGVATLICRCMDAQAKELLSQGFYELVPADTSGNLPAATRLETANPRGLPKDFFNPSDRLSRSLRLPRDF